jgi:hypothetical protein
VPGASRAGEWRPADFPDIGQRCESLPVPLRQESDSSPKGVRCRRCIGDGSAPRPEVVSVVRVPSARIRPAGRVLAAARTLPPQYMDRDPQWQSNRQP